MRDPKPKRRSPCPKSSPAGPNSAGAVEVASTGTLRLGGRPGTYSPEHAEIARGMRERGGTDADIASVLGITQATFLLWQVKFQEFSDACLVNEAALLRRAEDKIHTLAVGYTRIEQRIVVDHCGGQKIVTTKVEVPSNVEALKFVLVNGDPKKWQVNPKPPPQEPQDDPLAELLKQIQGSRIMPVALRPGEEKTGAVIGFEVSKPE